MPLYDIKCNQCDRTDEVFRRIENYNDLPECCGKTMVRVISPVYVPQEFQPYRSMVDGRMITDRGEHRRHLKASGCVEVGNESTERKPDLFKIKREKEALRQNIAERINSVA